MQRRTFLRGGVGAALVTGWGGTPLHAKPVKPSIQSLSVPPQARSVIPVVADGKWIWAKPPKETGYQEPRDFSLSVGIEMRGRGPASQIRATTTVPIEHPEQKIRASKIDSQGCRALLRRLAPTAGQLFLSAGSIVSGQTIRAGVST